MLVKIKIVCVWYVCVCMRRHANVEMLVRLLMLSGGGSGGEERGGRQFYMVNNMAYVYLLFYSPHFQALC